MYELILLTLGKSIINQLIFLTSEYYIYIVTSDDMTNFTLQYTQ